MVLLANVKIDHDLDNPQNQNAFETSDGVPQNVETDISVYAGRGILVESQGPTWFWGSSSEHSELYNYQFAGASNIFIGHMQTETPYYQPEPNVLLFAYSPGQGNFTMDPTFTDCSDANCLSSWALRMINSTNIFIYSAGFYSFFDNLKLGCGSQQNCQEHLVETNYVGNLNMYNLFTYGSVELVSPAGGSLSPIFFNDSNQSGYTSEVVAWLELSDIDAQSIGTNSDGEGGQVVYIDPGMWLEPPGSQTVACFPPCTLVLPPMSLSSPTTISVTPWTTVIEVGWTTTITVTQNGSTMTETTYTSVYNTTTISIPPITTNMIPVWNTIIPANVTITTINPTMSILPPPIILTDNPNPLSQSSVSHTSQNRTIYPPPFPYQTSKATTESGFPIITWTSSRPSPTCHSGCGSRCHFWCTPCNPLLPAVLGGCTGSDFCNLICPPGTGEGNGEWKRKGKRSMPSLMPRLTNHFFL